MNHADDNALIIDSGASTHCLDKKAEPHCTDVHLTNTGPSVQVANGEHIEPTKRAIVPLAKELSTQSKVGHIFDSLKSGSLISLGQLCDDDCVALFSKYDVKIYKNWTSYHCRRTQRRQRPVEHSTSTEGATASTNADTFSQKSATFSKRRNPKRQNQARPRSFPPCLRL
jgi:hypothetical protein